MFYLLFVHALLYTIATVLVASFDLLQIPLFISWC